ncbi:hypothetical protein GQ457_14G001230 [Hibiscus cannabinus]
MQSDENQSVQQLPPQEVQPPEIVPSWWTAEKANWETRFSTLEATSLENKAYLQRLIHLMSRETETMSPVPKQSILHPTLSKTADSTSTGIYFPRPKIEIPSFDGTNARGWVRKCDKYFSLFNVPDNQKMEIATMYLVGRAEIWFDSYVMQKHKATWHEFVADLNHRFCDKTHTDVIEEFNKLFQTATVEEYQDQFEALKPFMLLQNCHLPEGYFVSSFISGLKEELKHKVKVHEPATLADAYKKAKLYELAQEIETRKHKYVSKPPSPISTYNMTKPPTPSITVQTKTPIVQPTQKQSIIEFRRANNLCFKCGDRFSPSHQCKLKQLNMMEEDIYDPLEDECTEVAPNKQLQQSPEIDQDDANLEISINAITGNTGYSTIRIQGTIKGRPLNILIDSGSTHSFITPCWAKEGTDLLQTQPLMITVANGQQLQSNARCNQL